MNDFVAALRAVANHMRKYHLDHENTMSVEFNRNRDAVEVQVYGPDAFREWHRSLRNVTAVAELYKPGIVIVDMTGGILHATVRVRFYADASRQPAVFDALLSLITVPDSHEFEPIELPEILTRAAGGER